MKRLAVVLIVGLCFASAALAQQNAEKAPPADEALPSQVKQPKSPQMGAMQKMGKGSKPGGMMGDCPKMMQKMKGMMGKKRGQGIEGMMKAHMLVAGSGPLAPGRMMMISMGPGMGICGGAGKVHGKRPMINLAAAGLSPEQWTKVRELAYSHLKVRQNLKAQLSEECLKYAYLGSAAKIDAKSLTATMEKMGRIKAELFLNGRSYLDGLTGIVGQDGMNRAVSLPTPSGGM